MKASQFIEDLKTLIQERGDLEVIDVDGNAVMAVFNDDDGPAFVVE